MHHRLTVDMHAQNYEFPFSTFLSVAGAQRVADVRLLIPGRCHISIALVRGGTHLRLTKAQLNSRVRTSISVFVHPHRGFGRSLNIGLCLGGLFLTRTSAKKGCSRWIPVGMWRYHIWCGQALLP